MRLVIRRKCMSFDIKAEAASLLFSATFSLWAQDNLCVHDRVLRNRIRTDPCTLHESQVTRQH